MLNRKQRKLALAAGNDLGRWSQSRLDAELSADPALVDELTELREVRRAFSDLAEDDVASKLDPAVRARLRLRARAAAREAIQQPSAAPGWMPSFAGAALSACFVLFSLALMGGPIQPMPVNEPVPATQAVGAETGDVSIVLTRGANGAVLNWNGSAANERFLVLRSTRPGRDEVIANVCGHRFEDEAQPRTGLLSYRVVRVAERCS